MSQPPTTKKKASPILKRETEREAKLVHGECYVCPVLAEEQAPGHVRSVLCEREDVVVGDEAPLTGVAQVVSHGVKVVGVHEEEGKEKDEEVRVEVKGEVEENQGETLIMDGMEMTVIDSRTT